MHKFHISSHNGNLTKINSPANIKFISELIQQFALSTIPCKNQLSNKEVIQMRPLCTLLLTVTALIIFSCARMGSSIRLEDNILIGSHPKFSVKFNKEILAMEEKGTLRLIMLNSEHRKLVMVDSYTWIEQQVDYYYSLPHLASNLNFYYIDSVHFNDHEWAKIANYDEKEDVLFCGYMTRKDNAIVYIAVLNQYLDAVSTEAFKQYKRTMIMPEEALLTIKKEFEYFDENASVLY